MANKKQAQKYIRKTLKRTAANRQVRSRLRTLRKRVHEENLSDDQRQARVREFVSAVDKAAKRGIIHQNKANRHKAEVAPLLQSANA